MIEKIHCHYILLFHPLNFHFKGSPTHNFNYKYPQLLHISKVNEYLPIYYFFNKSLCNFATFSNRVLNCYYFNNLDLLLLVFRVSIDLSWVPKSNVISLQKLSLRFGQNNFHISDKK